MSDLDDPLFVEYMQSDIISMAEESDALDAAIVARTAFQHEKNINANETTANEETNKLLVERFDTPHFNYIVPEFTKNQKFELFSEKIINEFLEKYAPTKIIEIHGMEIEVSSAVSCLSNEDYNKKHGTNLKDVPQIPRSLLYSTDPEDQNKVAEYRKNIREIRQNNLYELYKKEYELALAKKREQEIQNRQQLDQSKKFDFDF